MGKKVSIIIPVHNSAKTIDRAVSSVLNQNYPNFEIVLIENNSTDNSLDFCKRMEQIDDRIIAIESKEIGVSAARNLGLKRCSGDIIGFCDADDYFCDNVFKNIVDELGDSDCIAFGYSIISRTYQKKCHFNKMKKVTSEEMLELVLNDSRIMGSVWNKFYTRQFIEDVSFDEELSYMEDTMFNAQLFSKKKAAVKILPLVSYNYLMNQTSVTNNEDFKYTKDNKLKYIITTMKIGNMLSASFRHRRLIGYKKFFLAINNYCKELKDAKKKNLIDEARKNFIYFLFSIGKYDLHLNLRLLIKYVSIVCKLY